MTMWNPASILTVSLVFLALMVAQTRTSMRGHKVCYSEGFRVLLWPGPTILVSAVGSWLLSLVQSPVHPWYGPTVLDIGSSSYG